MLFAQETSQELVSKVWAWHPHVEVWILVIGLVAAWLYMTRVIGPIAVAATAGDERQPIVTRKQVLCFVAAMLLFWLAADWPLHDLAEEYLYSAHMLQHMMMSYFLAPLVLLSIPEWMARALLGQDRVYRAMRFLTRPVVAGVIFNSVVMVTHIPPVVNHSVASAPLHYGLHSMLVLTSILMFMPVCGPIPEFQLEPAPKMIYLFLQSVVPTVPAAWLTFAEGTVYKAYDVPVRVWGLSVSQDQQLAGAIMKIGGSMYLWTIIGVIFFRHFVIGKPKVMRLRRTDEPVPQGFVNTSGLTFDDVQQAFDRSPAPTETSTPT